MDLPEQMVGSQRGDGCQALGGSAPCWRPRSPWDLPGPGELLQAWPSSGSRSWLLGQARLLRFQPWTVAQAGAPCEEPERKPTLHAQLEAYEQQQVQKSEMLYESLRFLGVMSHFCIEAAEFDVLWFFF